MKQRLRKACFIGAALFLSGCAYLFIFCKLGLSIPCVFHLITGLECPGCGTTRMFASLARLDFVAAWHFNPVVLVMLPFIAYIIVKDVVQWIKHGKTKSTRFGNYMQYAMVVVLVVFGIVRNIV